VTSTTAAEVLLTASIALSPSLSRAQTPENPSTTPTTTATAAQQTGRSAPLQHLGEGERLMNSIPLDSPKLKKDAKKKISELRERFAGFVKAYQVNGNPFVPAAVVQEADLKSEKETPPATWKEYFSDVEHDLAGILGGGSALASSTPAGAGSVGVPGVPVPVGTSGTTPGPVSTPGIAAGTQTSGASDTTTTSNAGTVAVVGEIGIKDLDPEVRRQLEQFRLELERSLPRRR